MFNVTYTNTCGSNVVVTCVPPSGSTFPVGTKTVYCDGADENGNVTSCVFSVIVNPPSGLEPVPQTTDEIELQWTGEGDIEQTTDLSTPEDRWDPQSGTIPVIPSGSEFDADFFQLANGGLLGQNTVPTNPNADELAGEGNPPGLRLRIVPAEGGCTYGIRASATGRSTGNHLHSHVLNTAGNNTIPCRFQAYDNNKTFRNCYLTPIASHWLRTELYIG